MLVNKSIRQLPALLVFGLLLVGAVYYFALKEIPPPSSGSLSALPAEAVNIDHQKQLLKQQLSHQRVHNTTVLNLSPEQVSAINEFVGASDRDVTLEDLSGGGSKLSLNGKYRHAVVLRREKNGNITKVEIGPNGIPVK